MTQHYHLASMAAWLSSTGIFPPQSPSSHPLDPSHPSQQQPLPCDCSTIPRLHVPIRCMYDCGKDCLILIPFRLPQVSCFTLSLKCFFDSDSCPDVRIGPLLQFPHLLRVDPVLLILLFFPLVSSFYQVLRDSIYSFPLVRYSRPLSAGVLHALLCLKVYS